MPLVLSHSPENPHGNRRSLPPTPLYHSESLIVNFNPGIRSNEYHRPMRIYLRRLHISSRIYVGSYAPERLYSALWTHTGLPIHSIGIEIYINSEVGVEGANTRIDTVASVTSKYNKSRCASIQER